MDLSRELITQFAKITKDPTETKKEVTVYGTIVLKDGVKYVQFDGSNTLTPAATTVDMLPGERVTAMIKNHSVVITGNMSSPSARSGSVTVLEQKVNNIGEVEALTNLEIESLINSVV